MFLKLLRPKLMYPSKMATRFLSILTVLWSFTAAPGIALAHPHVWIVVRSTIVFSPAGAIVGIRNAWTFDDMYSTFAMQGLQQRKKGEFTRQELQSLAQRNVESLKESNFFTAARADGKDLKFVEPTEYYFEFDHEQAVLTLHFLLPLQVPLKAKTFDFAIFDPESFVDFALAEKDPVTMEKAPTACTFTVTKPPELTEESAQRPAQSPLEGQTFDSDGAEFADRIDVNCP
jgi:ABC-type uncharacterized transport system substrate-binding protein